MAINPIQYLVSKGFTITSDPARYSSGVWGLRNYTQNGINYDRYCGGYHRAYDLAKYHLAPIPAVADGIVTAGTSSYGNFGGTVVVASEQLGFQTIYGHLDRSLPVKIGQKIKQGQTVGRQSFTHNGVGAMASHLHIQFQNYGYIPNEGAFVCSGISALRIDVSGGKGIKSPSKSDMGVLTYDSAWHWSGSLVLKEAINLRIYPHSKADREKTLKKGTTIKFDKLYNSDSMWWVRTKVGGGTWFMAVGKRDPKVKFLTALDGGKLWVSSKGKINTSKGREKGDPNTFTIADAYEGVGSLSTTETPKTFNKNINRGRSLTAYARGRVDMDYVHIRNRSGSQSRGFNWDKDTGDRLHRNSGDVYIYEIHNGWGRIYTGNKSGYGSNRWIYLDRFIPTEVFK